MGTVFGALLPIILTLALGFFVGWHHDFKPEQTYVLNRMVLLYALPHRWCRR
jgi:predicted permease